MSEAEMMCPACGATFEVATTEMCAGCMYIEKQRDDYAARVRELEGAIDVFLDARQGGEEEVAAENGLIAVMGRLATTRSVESQRKNDSSSGGKP